MEGSLLALSSLEEDDAPNHIAHLKGPPTGFSAVPMESSSQPDLASS